MVETDIDIRKATNSLNSPLLHRKDNELLRQLHTKSLSINEIVELLMQLRYSEKIFTQTYDNKNIIEHIIDLFSLSCAEDHINDILKLMEKYDINFHIPEDYSVCEYIIMNINPDILEKLLTIFHKNNPDNFLIFTETFLNAKKMDIMTIELLLSHPIYNNINPLVNACLSRYKNSLSSLQIIKKQINNTQNKKVLDKSCDCSHDQNKVLEKYTEILLDELILSLKKSRKIKDNLLLLQENVIDKTKIDTKILDELTIDDLNSVIPYENNCLLLYAIDNCDGKNKNSLYNLKLLLDKGVDIYKKNDNYGYDAIDVACLNANYNVMSIILKYNNKHILKNKRLEYLSRYFVNPKFKSHHLNLLYDGIHGGITKTYKFIKFLIQSNRKDLLYYFVEIKEIKYSNIDKIHNNKLFKQITNDIDKIDFELFKMIYNNLLSLTFINETILMGFIENIWINKILFLLIEKNQNALEIYKDFIKFIVNKTSPHIWKKNNKKYIKFIK